MKTQSLFGQKMASDYFDEAEKSFEENDYKNALTSFQYIVRHYPNNPLYPRAVFNVGYIYFLDKQFDSSLIVFKKILVSPFNEKDALGGGIMADPYANYKHRASEFISDIYENKKMYDTALYYFALSDTTYTYLHFCGNEYAEYDIHKALKYANLYKKMNKKNEAIASFLSAVFVRLADNSDVLSELKLLLKDKKNLKKDLETAIENIYPKSFESEGTTYTIDYIKFLNVEIRVPEARILEEIDTPQPNVNGEDANKTRIKNRIYQSNFYKMMQTLF